MGLPVLAVAAVLCGVGLALGGRRTARSRYRPDPWRKPEWIVAGSGAVALVAMAVTRVLDVPGLTISFSPLAFPSIPLLAVVGILIALAPAVAAPNPIAPPPTVLHEGSGTGGASAAVMDRPGQPVESDLSGVST